MSQNIRKLNTLSRAESRNGSDGAVTVASVAEPKQKEKESNTSGDDDEEQHISIVLGIDTIRATPPP